MLHVPSINRRRKSPVPLSFGLDNRVTIVLFAGFGGSCDGLEQAGFHVHVALNHDKVAVAVHERRHPHTKHLCQDVFEADPREVTQGRGVRALHASPDCTHFSVAKGGKPVSKRRRSLAWVVCRWAGTVRPETITLENVPEIQTWGGLIAKRDPATGRVMKLDGTVAAKGERVPVQEQWLVPDPKKRGRIWKAWLKHMHGLGYSFEGKVLVCADYGIPTIRKRYFGIAQADGRPIVWPERTHAPRHLAKQLGLKPWVGAHTIIDWSLPVKSIFDRRKPLADATLRRTAKGVMRYVVNAARPFIVPITHTGADRVHSLDEPLRTLTTAHRGELSVVAPSLQAYYGGEQGLRRGGDPQEPLQTFVTEPRHALVTAHLQRDFGNSIGANLDEPAPTVTPGGGGKSALVAAFMAQHNSGEPGRPADLPLSTIVSKGSTQGVVTASMMALRGTNRHGRDIQEPVATVTAGGCHAGVMAADLGEDANDNAHLILGFLQHYYSNGKQDDDIAAPLGALTQKARHGLVTATVGRETFVINDIGMRMLEPEEGAAAHGFARGSLPDKITIDGVERKLTKTEKYHLVGNSVPPEMIRLLAACNVRQEFAEAAE